MALNVSSTESSLGVLKIRPIGFTHHLFFLNLLSIVPSAFNLYPSLSIFLGGVTSLFRLLPDIPKVEAELLKNGKERTVLIFKKRWRKNSRRKNGHRQQFSLIRINKIFSKDGKVLSEAEKMGKKEVVVKEAKKEKIEASK